MHAVAGRADFLVDLIAALQLLAVERAEHAVPTPRLMLRDASGASFSADAMPARPSDKQDGKKSSEFSSVAIPTRASLVHERRGRLADPPFFASTAFDMLSGTGSGVSISPTTGVITKKCTK